MSLLPQIIHREQAKHCSQADRINMSSAEHLPNPLKQPSSRSSSSYKLQLPEKFFSRLPELRLVKDRLIPFLDGAEVDECIINFYGVAGIGKTALIAKILADVAQTPRPQGMIIELSFETLFPLPQSTPSASQSQQKQCFLMALCETLPDSPDSAAYLKLMRGVKALSATTAEEQYNDLLLEIATYLKTQPKRVLLVLDAWEYIPEVMAAWIERYFLLTLVSGNRLFGLFGSQMELGWRQYDVRRRVELYQVPPLDENATFDQIMRHADPVVYGESQELRQQFYHVTHGYPLSNEYLHEQITKQYKHTQFDELTKTLKDKPSMLTQGIRSKIQARVLGGISDELQYIISVMAFFREFDITTLRRFMPRYYKKQFENFSQSAFSLKIRELNRTRLIHWNEQTRSYALDPSIRYSYHASPDPDLPNPVDIRNDIILYYEELITDKDIESAREIYIVEYCYQCLALQADQGAIEALGVRLKQFLETYYTKTLSAAGESKELDRLYELFIQDTDINQYLRSAAVLDTYFLHIVKRFAQGSLLKQDYSTTLVA